MAIGQPPRPDDTRLMELLKVFEERSRHTHQTIWEVEKHFTWWVYVVFGAIAAVVLTDVLTSRQKEFIALLLGLAGTFMAFIGYRVLTLESIYFDELRDIWRRIFFLLSEPPGFAATMGQPNGVNLKLVLPSNYFLTTPQTPPTRGLQGFGVRRAFQTVMVMAGVAFVAIIGAAAVLLLTQ